MAHLYSRLLHGDPVWWCAEPSRSPAPDPGEASGEDDGRMDGRYVRMLEHWLERYRPSHWPVSVVRDTLEQIREADQYGGESPTVVSAEAYAAVRVEDAPLLNTVTGEVEPAVIYRMERIEDA